MIYINRMLKRKNKKIESMYIKNNLMITQKRDMLITGNSSGTLVKLVKDFQLNDSKVLTSMNPRRSHRKAL